MEGSTARLVESRQSRAKVVLPALSFCQLFPPSVVLRFPTVDVAYRTEASAGFITRPQPPSRGNPKGISSQLSPAFALLNALPSEEAVAYSTAVLDGSISRLQTAN